MSKGNTAAVAALVWGLVVATPWVAAAQDNRLRVSLGGATTAGAIDSEPAVTGSVGYRFSERLSFEVDVMWVPSPTDRFTISPAAAGRITGLSGMGLTSGTVIRQGGGIPFDLSSGVALIRGINPTIFPPFRIERDGTTTIATVGLRYEFPTQSSRLMPYVSAGLGVSRTDEEFGFVIPVFDRPVFAPAGMLPFSTRNLRESVTHTALAGSLGVGASLRVFKDLSLDLDARYYRLDLGRNLGRLGGGVSYRF